MSPLTKALVPDGYALALQEACDLSAIAKTTRYDGTKSLLCQENEHLRGSSGLDPPKLVGVNESIDDTRDCITVSSEHALRSYWLCEQELTLGKSHLIGCIHDEQQFCCIPISR